MILAQYTLEIHGDDVADASSHDFDLRDARVLADLPAMLEELEENLSSLLPEGYKAQIRRDEP